MNVAIFEEHASSLAHWWREHAQARTVVYLDAHLDLQFVNDERMKRLEACTTADEVEALAKPHHLWPDRQFSYSLENFLYPAARLGLIDRVVWVAPPHVSTAYSRENLDRLCQMDGVRFDELLRFHKAAGGWIEGRLLGLELAICDAHHLEQIALPPDSRIDIDIDYFVTVPGDAAWVNPRAVFAQLRRLPQEPPVVTIARSVESGFTPLRYRYFADYLAALWDGRARDSDHFDRLYQLDCRLRAGEREMVIAGCQEELESYPQCAATWYLLGMTTPDHEQAATCQSRAAALSSAYRPNPLRSACAIRSRRLPVTLAEVMTLERHAAESSSGPEERGLAEAEFGLVYSVFGQVGRAIDCYRRATGLIGEHPELALEIAKRLVENGQPAPAVALLHTALADDKTRTTAHLLLARVDILSGRLDQAQQHLEEASAAAPAWGQLLDMLAFVHQQLGNVEQVGALQERSAQLRQQAEQLAEQLR